MILKRTSYFIIFLCSFIAFELSAQPSFKPEVIIENVKEKTFFDPIQALGTLKALNAITITSNQTEKVAEVLFEDGQTVEKGDVLVRLNQREEREQLRSAEALLSEAKEAYERAERLRRNKVVSDASYKEDRKNFLQAEALVEEIKARLAELTIHAPFSGIVGLTDISVGALVEVGDPITTLDHIHTLKLDFNIPALYLSQLQKGLTVKGHVKAYPDQIFEGKVFGIDSRVNPNTRTVVIRARVDNTNLLLKPGLLMTVTLSANERKVIAIPEKALQAFGSEFYIFVYDAKTQTVKKTNVQIGKRFQGFVEITEGLKKQDSIVTEGQIKIRDGMIVRPRQMP